MRVRINWDTNGKDVDLPIEVEVPDDLDSEEEILDYLSDEYGFLVEGWAIVSHA